MKNKNSSPLTASLFLYLIVLALPLIAEAGQRRVHITDDLDDVVDDEEDEQWKQWGHSSRSAPSPPDLDPPPDFSKMDLSQIQEEMMRRHVGPTFGFVKLRLGVRRTRVTLPLPDPYEFSLLPDSLPVVSSLGLFICFLTVY